MKLQGEFTLEAPRQTVWDILTDPEIIQKHMPGCQGMQETAPGEFDAEISIGIGAIRGTYKAHLTMKDKQEPEQYRLAVNGSGKPGHVQGEGVVSLSEQDGKTVLSYNGDLQVGGTIARVGQRMLGSVAEKMTRQFFQSLSDEAVQKAASG